MRVFFFLTLLATFCLSQSAYPEGRKPYYEHLAFTGDPSSMLVGWFTQEETAAPMVKYGADGLSSSAVGYSSHYFTDYGYDHYAVMTGLTPGQRYAYVVGDNEGGWSVTFQFVAGTHDAEPFTIAVVGDMGIDNSEGTANALTLLAVKDQIDWLWHIGDISYADDHFWDYGYTWNYFFNMIRPISSKMPYMVLPGNHEYSAMNWLYYFTKDFKVYNDKFHMPGNASGSNTSMYHSFDYGLVHFICLSTESSFPKAMESPDLFGDELVWLENDLLKAVSNRKNRPWIIVGMHRPIYSSATDFSVNGVPVNTDRSNSLDLQQAFEDLFMKYKVDVVFQAHVHAYERSYPVFNNQVTSKDYNSPPSPFYITSANGGCLEGLVWEWNDPLPAWSAIVDAKEFGYGTLSIVNATQLVWQQFSSSTNQVIDKVILNKN
jgi:hypothetical protein